MAAALYGPMIHYDAELLRPVLVIFLALLMLWMLIRWMENGRIAWAAGAGLFLGLLGALALSASIPAAHAQNERLVLAFYYAWFDRNIWSSGQCADQPVQPYDSRDRAAIQRHVAQAWQRIQEAALQLERPAP